MTVSKCAACEFEKKHGTEKNPRPVHDLEIHSCGQVTCFFCGGYTVINGSPGISPFHVMGGDPCPVCSGTGRVPGEAKDLYKPRCYNSKLPGDADNSEPVFNTSPNVLGWQTLRCSLEFRHGGDCLYKPSEEVQKEEIARAKDCVKRAMGVAA